MKKIILSVAAILSIAFGYAQGGGAFEQGDKLLNAGLGIGAYYGPGSSISVGGSFEYGVSDFISVGGQLDFYRHKESGFRFTYVPVAARGSYHFGKHFLTEDNIDLYGGLSLGYYFFSDNITNNGYPGGYDDGGLFLGIFAGARYYIQPNFSFFGELGANTAPLKLGVTFKL